MPRETATYVLADRVVVAFVARLSEITGLAVEGDDVDREDEGEDRERADEDAVEEEAEEREGEGGVSGDAREAGTNELEGDGLEPPVDCGRTRCEQVICDDSM